MKNDENTLFETKLLWEEEWTGMPEFIQDDLTSFRKIIVHFRNNDNVLEFSKLINQKITPKQPSLWFPYMEFRKSSHLVYVNA